MSLRWAVFLDRDGTLNEEVGLITRPEELRLIPGVPKALLRLREAGALLVVVTNQPVVARGLIPEEALVPIHDQLKRLLAREGVSVDAIYYCPHHPEKDHPEARDPRYRRDCGCRKPKPGMLLDAARDLGIDLGRSFMVGDHGRDVGAGKAVGCGTVLVGSRDCADARPDARAADMSAAADWILARRHDHL
ncbi:MAG: HAD family hydrolase [Elusimicrobiota bacterium]